MTDRAHIMDCTVNTSDGTYWSKCSTSGSPVSLMELRTNDVDPPMVHSTELATPLLDAVPAQWLSLSNTLPADLQTWQTSHFLPSLSRSEKKPCDDIIIWHGAADAFRKKNDIEDHLKNPRVPGESHQWRLMSALVDFDKPLIAAVRGAAIGGGTIMLTHFDSVYASESAKYQKPFVNLALVPESGSSCSVPAKIGRIRAVELSLLGRPLDAMRAADLGEQIEETMRAKMKEFSARARSKDAKKAFMAFLEKRA